MLPILVSLALFAADPPVAPAPVAPAPAAFAIGGNAKVLEHKIVRLAAVGVPPGAALIWDVSDEAKIDPVESKDGSTYLFAAPPGVYAVKLRALTFGDNRATLTARLTVTIGKGLAAPPVKPPDKPPVVKPPAPIVSKDLYFAVVRADGPASPAFTAAMGLAEWDELRKAGHSVKDFDFVRATTLLGPTGLPAGTTLPCVVTLRTAPEGSTLLRGPVPLPTTGAAVLDLLKGL